MSIRLLALAGLAAMILVACENAGSHALSPSPSSAAMPTAALAAHSADDVQHAVSLMDACDPDSFNAALGPGTCSRPGGMLFNTFLDQLGKHGSVGAWHMAPSVVSMRVGQLLVANNRGGETHTFTEVEEYGGGIVPLLNQLAGLTTVAPECGQLAPGDFLAPGASSSDDEDEAGVEKYQCCIHPWMRAEIRVSEK